MVARLRCDPAAEQCATSCLDHTIRAPEIVLLRPALVSNQQIVKEK